MKKSFVFAVLAFTAGSSGLAQTLPALQWPSGRAGHVMAYDVARGETVLFGGDTDKGSQTRDSVWAWSGSAWRVSGAAGPGWRTLPAAAYDTRRRRTVLHGGLIKVSALEYGGRAADTWEWDGDRWEPLRGPSPGARDHHAMAYDEARGVTVMYGGVGASGGLTGETWAFDGIRWLVVADSAAGPGLRAHHAMAYDSRRQRVVLFGGTAQRGTQPPTDTWEWDGRRWERVVVDGPGPRARHRLAYDAARGVVIMFGGTDSATWSWDGTRWSAVAQTGPDPRGMSAMAYDARRQRVVLYGGGDLRADLWEWTGARWVQVSPVRPGPRGGSDGTSRSSVMKSPSDSR
jgi:hypothetical protein